MTAMIDPVCGKSVTEAAAQAAVEYQGRRYLFCSRGCRAAFEREPEVCLTGSGLQKVSDPQGIDRWVCKRPDVPKNQNPERDQCR